MSREVKIELGVDDAGEPEALRERVAKAGNVN